MNTKAMRHDGEVASGRAVYPDLIDLASGSVRAWSPDGKQIVIVAVEGAVWITQTAGTRDLILRRGETFRSRGEGRVVVETLTPRARVAIRWSAPAATTARGSMMSRIRGYLGVLFAGRRAATGRVPGGRAPMGC